MAVTPIQTDLFAPQITSADLRHVHELMERPFTSLSKKKRIKPIEHTAKDGSFVRVEAHPSYGLPTIWDEDFIIYAGSVINNLKNQGVNDLPRSIRCYPYEILTAVHRSTGGTQYKQLRSALQSFKHSTITTSLRAGSRKKVSEFSLIQSWSEELDEVTAHNYGITIELSEWCFNCLAADGNLLKINPAYFNLSGGYERWLYMTSRRHAGPAYQNKGFLINYSTLYAKSGSTSPFRRFKFEINDVATKGRIPDFEYAIENRESPDPQLRIFPRSTKAKSIHSTLILPDKASPGSSRELLEHTRSRIVNDFPNLDAHGLERLQNEFDAWLAKTGITPQHYSSELYGFIKNRLSLTQS